MELVLQMLGEATVTERVLRDRIDELEEQLSSRNGSKPFTRTDPGGDATTPVAPQGVEGDV